MKKQILSTIVALNLGLILPAETALAAAIPDTTPPSSTSSSNEAPGSEEEPGTTETPSTVTGPSMKAVTAEEATSSKNINGHNYVGNWNNIATSYLYENKSGGLTRVECTGGKVVIENYNSDFEFQDIKTLDMELSRWGGFYAGEDYNFLAFIQYNPTQDNSREVLRIVKYTKDWERVDSISLSNLNSVRIGDTGNVAMVQDGDFLYIHSSHDMYKAYDGYNHQASFSLSIKISDMTVNQQYTGSANVAGYTSHSFHQLIATDGSTLITVDHGDTYPRTVRLTRCPNKSGEAINMGTCYSVHILPIKAGRYLGDNYTGVSVGGLVVTDSSYLVAGNSIPQDKDSTSTVRNIFVTSTPKDEFTQAATKTYWITNYTAGSKASVSNPQLIKIDDDNILLLCTVNGRILYTTLDGEGVPKGVIRENGTTCTIDELLNESTKEDETPNNSDNETETLSDSDNENETPGDSDSENESPSDPGNEDESKDNGIYTLNKTEEGDWYLSDCVPIVYNDKVVWYFTNNSKPVFCSIDLNYPGDIINSEEFNQPGNISTTNPGINPNPGSSDDQTPPNVGTPEEPDTPSSSTSSSSSRRPSSSSSSTTASPSYTGQGSLNSSEQTKVANAAASVLGQNTTIASAEKTDTGICITSKSGDVIFSKADGSLATNEWEKVGDTWYYFDADKKAAKGWKQLGDKWYYLDDTTSKMVTGWKQTATGNWFYLDAKNGDMKTDWQFINNKWYYLDSKNGDMKTDWQLVNGKWYYLDLENGNMKTGWITWNNQWYYLDTANGDCLMNTVTPDGYTTDANGAWIP